MSADRPPIASRYARLLAEAHTDTATGWADAARAARQAAEDLHRIRRELPEHWRSGRGRDDADEALRLLLYRLEEAAETYRRIADALTTRDRELAAAREVVTGAVADARRAGLDVTADGRVTAAGDAPLTLRAHARRLSTVVADTLAHAASADDRAAGLVAALSVPR